MNSSLPIDSHFVHRAADSFSGYRFVTNIAAGDLDRALRAAKIAAPAGEIRLVLIACGEFGLPLKGAALYVLNHLPDPNFFWNLYHSLAPSPQVSNF